VELTTKSIPTPPQNSGRVSLRNCRLGLTDRFVIWWLSGCAPPPRSVDRTRSPAVVSQKREYFKYLPETIGDFALRLCRIGSLETERKSAKKPQLAGIYRILEITISSCRTAWLGREPPHSSEFRLSYNGLHNYGAEYTDEYTAKFTGCWRTRADHFRTPDVAAIATYWLRVTSHQCEINAVAAKCDLKRARQNNGLR
jgi:hypothetical protein